jgi:spore coat protein CotF
MASSVIDSLFGNATGADLNPTIGLHAIAAVASSCTAYLAATLQSTTPEVHRLFSEYLNQSLIAHEGLTSLAIKRGWMQPYTSAEEQLKMSYQNSESIMQHNEARQ